MKKISHILMLSCQKATELVEKRSLFPLNPVEKTQLFLHMQVCSACRTYIKQSDTLDQVLKDFLNPPEEKDEEAAASKKE